VRGPWFLSRAPHASCATTPTNRRRSFPFLPRSGDVTLRVAIGVKARADRTSSWHESRQDRQSIAVTSSRYDSYQLHDVCASLVEFRLACAILHSLSSAFGGRSVIVQR
jgi:hypothetical protein